MTKGSPKAPSDFGKIEIGRKTLEAIKGDITDYDGEAIVNAANNHFWMGGGVAGAIKRRGGIVIEQEAMRQGPKPVGEAVITSAGTLKAKHVIHTAVMGQDLSEGSFRQTDETKILSAVRSALRLAELNKIESVAFPALGTGVGGFPLSEAARIMTKEANSFLSEGSFRQQAKSLRRVTFVLFDDEAYDAFAEELRKLKQ